MKGLVYRLVHVIIFLFAKIVFRLKIIGHSNIPEKGGAIIAANHVSYLDPPLIGCSISRRVNFMAMSELFKNPFCGAFYKAIGAFPVRRAEADAVAIRHAVRLLKKGEVVLIFPEGTRSFDGRLQEPKGGVGVMAALSKAKIIPTFIKGTEKALPRGTWRLRISPVTVFFGEPLEFTENLFNILRQPGLHSLSKERKRLYSDMNIKIIEGIAKMQRRAISQESE